MKKKLLITPIAIATITLSATAVYADGIGWTKNIYKVSSNEDGASTVSKFRDGDTTCYVLSGNGASSNFGANSISCVRTK